VAVVLGMDRCIHHRVVGHMAAAAHIPEEDRRRAEVAGGSILLVPEEDLKGGNIAG